MLLLKMARPRIGFILKRLSLDLRIVIFAVLWKILSSFCDMLLENVSFEVLEPE